MTDLTLLDVDRYLKNRQNEVDSSAQYRELQRLETDPRKKEIFAGLATIEEKHVVFWENQLTHAGVEFKAAAPSWRSHILIIFARFLGPSFVLPTIRDLEGADKNAYVSQTETKGTSMASDERHHAFVLNQIDRVAPSGVEGSFLARIEGRHHSVGGNALRASVLGVNDGLCSNLSLIMGVFGLATNEKNVLLTGLAGLFAGACSMALGEWLSVTSSRELAEREIQIESDELKADPASERDELRLIYESKGLSKTEADELSGKMMSDPDRALDTLAREELGIDPGDLSGSPNEAALFSFFLFAIGAVIPLLPLMFSKGQTAFGLSLLFGGGALFGFGALTTIFTGKPAWSSGLRQMLLGLFAAGLTFGLGHFLGKALTF